MTSDLNIPISPDEALVINPKHLGISATGRELEKLFVEFCKQNSQSAWQFELGPQGDFIAMRPVNHPVDAHENALDLDLGLWAQVAGGEGRNSSAAF